MGDVKKVRTACRQCHGGCGVIDHVKEGKVICTVSPTSWERPMF